MVSLFLNSAKKKSVFSLELNLTPISIIPPLGPRRRRGRLPWVFYFGLKYASINNCNISNVSNNSPAIEGSARFCTYTAVVTGADPSSRDSPSAVPRPISGPRSRQAANEQRVTPKCQLTRTANHPSADFRRRDCSCPRQLCGEARCLPRRVHTLLLRQVQIRIELT